jgi:hypothetical protein
MDPVTIGAAAVGVGAASGLANTYMQWKNLQYQKDLQRDIFAREDTSIARRVADLKASGLSPVLAAGQGAGTGGVVSTQAPQFDTSISDKAINALGLLKMEQDIAHSQTQQELLAKQISEAGARASIAWHDAKVLEGSPGMLSTSSGIAKDIRELLGLFGLSPQDIKNGASNAPGHISGALESITKKFRSIQSPLTDSEKKKQNEVMREGYKNIENLIKTPFKRRTQ